MSRGVMGSVRAGWMLGACALLGLPTSCESEAESAPGQLVVSIETDMALPTQIDSIRVQVLVRGQTFLDADYEVGTSDNPIPATLTVLAGKDPSQPVTIRVAGSKARRYRTLREVTTTVPKDRVASLRMPVQWLCDGTAEEKSSGDPTRPDVESTCNEGNSCVAGRCVPTEVAMEKLPDYEPEAVFGGAELPEDGTCFDTLPCMISGVAVEPDDDCQIERPRGQSVNVALRVASDGICDDTGIACFVPLDGNSDEGWQPTRDGKRLRLPQAACDKLRGGRVSAVYVSTRCETKTSATPPCGDWTNVANKAEPAAPAPGVSEPEPPRVSIAAELAVDEDNALCCPLIDGPTLYTCSCTSKSEARLLAIDPVTGDVSEVAELSPSAFREHTGFGATVVDGEVYWVDDGAVGRRMIGDGGEPERIAVSAAIYEDAPLLADGTDVFALASGLEGAMGSPVKLLRIDRGGSVTPIDTGGNTPVYQFAQGEGAVFLAIDDDSREGELIARESSVLRIDKNDGTRMPLLPVQSLQTPERLRGGYVGVAADGEQVFALFESAPQQDGTARVALHAAAADGSSAEAEVTPLYEVTVDPALSQLVLLGALDGAVLLSRIEYESEGEQAGGVRSASVVVVPGGGGAPRILADLTRDYPLPGIGSDADHLYFLSSSGQLFAVARSALE